MHSDLINEELKMQDYMTPARRKGLTNANRTGTVPVLEPRTAIFNSDPDAAVAPQGDAIHWRDIAEQENRNKDYYIGLLAQCAEYLGPDVYVSDDGFKQIDFNLGKIPGLVAELHRKAHRIDEQFDEETQG